MPSFDHRLRRQHYESSAALITLYRRVHDFPPIERTQTLVYDNESQILWFYFLSLELNSESLLLSWNAVSNLMLHIPESARFRTSPSPDDGLVAATCTDHVVQP